MKKDYEIGYGKPPVHTRFVKGKSGNPKGRPRKECYGHRTQRSHIRDDMERLLPLRIHAHEGGRTKRITIQRAQIRGLVNRAIDGDNPSIHQLWILIKHFGVDREPNKNMIFWRHSPQLDRLSRHAGKVLNAIRHGTPIPKLEKATPDEDERPPKRANLMDDLLLELQERVAVTELGKQKRITKQEALLRSLLAKSMGNISTFRLFWVMFRHYGLDQEPDKYLHRLGRREWEWKLREAARRIEREQASEAPAVS
jgi:hypothetical protein